MTVRRMSKKDVATVREAAGQEWDRTFPRWSMPREKFIDWHLRMARGELRPRGGQ